MFRDVKKGDKVFDYIRQKCGTVLTRNHSNEKYHLKEKFGKQSYKLYTFEGKEYTKDKTPVLFWDEALPIVPPKKPLPDLKVDTRVIVCDDINCGKYRRHFSHFEPDGTIICFTNGNSEWTSNGSTTDWEHWELAE